MPAKTMIVVPCYNEEGRFNAAAFAGYLATHADVGFVLVNDGSRDNTLGVLRSVENAWPDRAIVIDQQPNQGKAEAVRVGLLQAMQVGAKYVGYFDADLATPLDTIGDFGEVLDARSDIDLVLGSRIALLGRYIQRHAWRHYLGRVFATAASLVLALPVYDTQCGAKLMRANSKIRSIFSMPFRSRWIFDVEMIARYLRGSTASEGIYELPLHRWTDVQGSRVRAKDYLRAGAEMAAIYRTYRLSENWRIFLSFVSAPFVRYVGAGGIGTGFHYLFLALAVEGFRMRPDIATLCGAVIGACVNYVLNYHLTFASESPHRKTLPRFFAIAAFTAVLNALLMSALVSGAHQHYLVAQIICTAVVLLVGFGLNRAWTFRRSRDATTKQPAVLLPATSREASHARTGTDP